MELAARFPDDIDAYCEVRPSLRAFLIVSSPSRHPHQQQATPPGFAHPPPGALTSEAIPTTARGFGLGRCSLLQAKTELITRLLAASGAAPPCPPLNLVHGLFSPFPAKRRSCQLNFMIDEVGGNGRRAVGGCDPGHR